MPNWLTTLLGGLAGGATSIILLFIFFVSAPWESIGALSGWAAAIGTVTAALITLGPLRAQLKEAKRQTDFILGDSLPSLHITPIHFWQDKTIAIAKITNWNRRPFHLKKIQILTENNADIEIYKFYIGNSLREPRSFRFNNGAFGVPLVLSGWIDRTIPPSEGSIYIGMAVQNFVYTDNSSPSILTVYAEGSIIDASHKHLELKSTCRTEIYIN